MTVKLSGYETQIGYMPQDHHEIIEVERTAHRWLWRWNEEANEEQLRGLFGRLCSPKMSPSANRVLSGGGPFASLGASYVLKPNVLLWTSRQTTSTWVQSVPD